MRRFNVIFVAVCVLAGLAGCGAKPSVVIPRPDAPVQAAASEYVVPPAATYVGGGRAGPSVSGTAPAGGQVRLATPDGQARLMTADGKGQWATQLAGLAKPAIFGLSVTSKGRQVQAEGYVLVTPDQRGALLRAGSAALRLDAGGPGLRSLDFDREGGAVVSAALTPGATATLKFDGGAPVPGRASARGRVEFIAPTPLAPGLHSLQLAAEGVADTVQVQVSSPAPLVQGPLRSQLTPAGLRADWLTPGGGVQSTILIH